MWHQTCQQPYLPRPKDDTVFQAAMGAGAESRDFFGFAQGREGSRYLGFSYGKRASLFMDAALLLIEPSTAAAYLQAERAAEEAARPQPTSAETQGATGSTITRGGGTPAPHAGDSANGGYPSETPSPASAVKKHFYGSIDLDPFQAKKQFADLVDEVVQQFTFRPGVRVKIAIEIQADSDGGFDDGLQRAVKENCNVLRFKNAEFEAGD